MSEADNNNRNDGWHDNGRYVPRPDYPTMTSANPANVYLLPNGQEQSTAFIGGAHQPSSIHHNNQPMHHFQQQHHQQQQQQQQQQQHALHQQMQHPHMQPQPLPPPQFVQHAEYSGPPRSDGFTVLRTAHGDYLKVYYNNEDAMNYNNYELFSNNSFIPHHMMKPPHSTQSNQEHFYHSNTPSNQQIDDRNSLDNNNTNFINQLVENWVPNISGTYTPFGESPLPPQPMSSVQMPQQATHNNPTTLANSAESRDEQLTKQQSTNAMIFQSSCQMPSDDQTLIQNNVHATVNAHVQPSRTNGSFQHESIIPKTNNEGKKPRMVAEVKPMRMSYSDVLSKNVFRKNQSESQATNGGNSVYANNNMPNGGSNSILQQKSTKQEKNKISFNTADKKSSSVHDDKDASVGYKFTKIGTSNSSTQSNLNAKSSLTIDTESSRDSKHMEIDSRQAKKKTASNATNGKSVNRSVKITPTELLNKRRSQSDLNASQASVKEETDKSSQNNCFFYNITKNEPSQTEKSVSSSCTKSTQQRKSASVKTSTSASTANRNGPAKTEKSSAYQQKRIQKTRKNNTYTLILKLANAWFDYMLLFVKWLVALVCDVFLLSFGIIWDRFSAGFDYACHVFASLRNELTTNSGRPSAYFINLWQRFDQKFCKDSKWAVWRRLFAKKKPPEPVPDYYKNGRLPQTGDEAMYSLLNCKGKDAYSILGVQADCSQEQIRKHYKKIAVLVHPDKNKQPGAEEAFKILQRAFELIGEPENRKSYDQSVAEALNAEKAWSELNDLLRQLQTKIAEAANTIRCSSCGLRHPRKPTGRPHFAARQCNSCKIRHTAREGDIWAETSLFGMRWKYLALMEGKVLDITEWANCQKGALSHLQPNSHIVQYRIVLGGQQQQQQQQQQSQQQPQHPHQPDKDRVKRDQTTEPSLDEFLDNLYSGQNPQSASAARRRNRKN